MNISVEELIERQTKINSIDKSQRPSELIMTNQVLHHLESHSDSHCHCSGAATVLRNDQKITFSDFVNSLRAN